MDSTFFDENSILDLIPDGVIALDRDLIIRQVNPAACRLLGLAEPAELLGSPVGTVMDDAAFLRLRDGEDTQFSDIAVLRGGEILLECSCQCDEARNLFVCVMRSLPNLPQSGEHEELLRRELRAVELADALCEKQLNTVQEIAGLLGESAVDMQASLQELKRALFPGKAGKNG